MKFSIKINHSDLSNWMTKNAKFSLQQFDEVFEPTWRAIGPMDTLYAITIIESMFKTGAVSSANARGLWQGIPESGWPSSVSADLRDHLPMLRAMVSKYRGLDLVDMYLRHHLPAVSANSHPSCRYAELHVPYKTRGYGTANLQFVSLVEIGGEVVPVWDKFEFLKALAKRLADMSVRFEMTTAPLFSAVGLGRGRYVSLGARVVNAPGDLGFDALDSRLVGSRKSGSWGPYSTPAAIQRLRGLIETTHPRLDTFVVDGKVQTRRSVDWSTGAYDLTRSELALYAGQQATAPSGATYRLADTETAATLTELDRYFSSAIAAFRAFQDDLDRRPAQQFFEAYTRGRNQYGDILAAEGIKSWFVRQSYLRTLLGGYWFQRAPRSVFQPFNGRDLLLAALSVLRSTSIVTSQMELQLMSIRETQAKESDPEYSVIHGGLTLPSSLIITPIPPMRNSSRSRKSMNPQVQREFARRADELIRSSLVTGLLERADQYLPSRACLDNILMIIDSLKDRPRNPDDSGVPPKPSLRFPGGLTYDAEIEKFIIELRSEAR